MHWHVVLTHFPISFFMVSAGFMGLHLFTSAECFEMASFLSLVAGAVMMIPTTLSGWWTWKTKFRGAGTALFKIKINMSFAMLALSLALVWTRGLLMDLEHTMWHVVFWAGFLLLFAGALAEGFFGGQLNHR
jgi:hypothetical protein